MSCEEKTHPAHPETEAVYKKKPGNHYRQTQTQLPGLLAKPAPGRLILPTTIKRPIDFKKAARITHAQQKPACKICRTTTDQHDRAKHLAAKQGTPNVPGYDSQKAVKDQDATVKAKLIRAMLKEEFPGVEFRVKTSRYSMGESIHVYWADGPALDKVEPLLKKYEDLNMDPSTGEILCGGNSHVFTERSILPETQKKIDSSVRARFGKTEQEWPDWDNGFSSQRWQTSRSTDFPNQSAPKF